MYVGLHVKYPLILSAFSEIYILLIKFRKMGPSNFTHIRLGGTELVHADGRTDRHDKTNSGFLRTRLQPDYERIDITVSQVCLDICYVCDVMALTSLVGKV